MQVTRFVFFLILCREVRKRKIREQYSGREKIMIDVAFNFLKIVVIREARNRKGVLQVRKETVRIEVAVASIMFNSKTVKLSCQSNV